MPPSVLAPLNDAFTPAWRRAIAALAVQRQTDGSWSCADHVRTTSWRAVYAAVRAFTRNPATVTCYLYESPETGCEGFVIFEASADDVTTEKLEVRVAT